jgi:hypothetical protein
MGQLFEFANSLRSHVEQLFRSRGGEKKRKNCSSVDFPPSKPPEDSRYEAKTHSNGKENYILPIFFSIFAPEQDNSRRPHRLGCFKNKFLVSL